ncbi:hypothetical protein [Streptomyces sp. NPDC005408]|uniref:hypothetical protein n=1 Tax=Streptomyces sp. NPDC005408 TaxID=3155341 RepID=UPI0033A3BAFE
MPRATLSASYTCSTTRTARKIRRPEPVRGIYAAVRETSLPQPALRGLLDALREAAQQ